MGKAPWGYKEGWVICAGIFLTGVILQFFFGKINPELFRFPVNLIFGVLFLVGLVSFHLASRKIKRFQWFTGFHAGITSFGSLLLLLIIMGLTPQKPSFWDLSQEKGFFLPIGFSQISVSWYFLLISFYLLWILGLVILKRVNSFKWKDTRFLLSHTGLFIAFFSAILGSSDLQHLQMVVPVNGAEWRAVNERKEIVELPFAIELKSFTIDEYPPALTLSDTMTGKAVPKKKQKTVNEKESLVMAAHKPKGYISEVTVYTQNKKIEKALIEVNKPLSISGWKIYQWGYDKVLGKRSRYSVFKLVKDHWQPAVYTGIVMMLAGALFSLLSRVPLKWQYYRSKPVVVLFAGILIFTFIIAAIWLSPERTKTLMPALQSHWFLPHVIAYMVAYALLAVTALYAFYFLLSPCKTEQQKLSPALCDHLVYAGSAFLCTGMLLGAIWAKEAWGDYWSWDPKETWAAITWIAYLIYIHFRLHHPKKEKIAIYLLLFSFLLLQICWFGINYLLAYQGNSLHVYR